MISGFVAITLPAMLTAVHDYATISKIRKKKRTNRSRGGVAVVKELN